MELLGPYQLQEELARGGAGVVYRAWDPRASRAVAIKRLLAGSAAAPDQLERFRREAEALGRLRHPHIVRLHTVDWDQGSPYLVLDFVAGENLGDRLRRRGPFPQPEATRICLQLAEALEHAHAAGLLHRDVKPHNVLLAEGDHPLLTDFGLARVLEDARGLTRSGALLGTPGFMPPEQAFGLGPPGPQADVYGLGATLYALLTGEPPHAADSMTGFLAALSTREVPSPRELRAEVDPGLEAVCLRALRRDPRERYPTAAALAEDLRAILEGRAPGALQERRRRRAGRLLGLALAGLALVAAALLASRARPGPSRPERPLASLPPPSGAAAQPTASLAASPPAGEGEGGPAPDALRAALDVASPDDVTKAQAALAELAPEQGADLSRLARTAQEAGLLDLYKAQRLVDAARQRIEDEGDATAGLELLDQAVAAAPKDARTLAHRGWYRYGAGDREGGKEDLLRARELGPREWDTCLYLGHLLLEEGDPAGALEAWAAGSGEDGKRDDRCYHQARAALAGGDPAAALDYALASRRKKAPEVLAVRATALHLLGRDDEARAQLEAGLSASRANPWLLTARARLLLEVDHDLDGALRDLRRAVRQVPDHLADRHLDRRLAARDHHRALLKELRRALAECPEGDARGRELATLIGTCQDLEQNAPAFLPYR